MGVYQIWVLDPKEWDIWFAGAPYNTTDNGYAKSLKDWAMQENADLCWNLAFFNTGTQQNIKNKCAYRNLEYVKGKGYILGYGGTDDHLVWNSQNECAGWKVAIKNGVVQKSNIDNTVKRTRNMNGITTDGRYIHVQTTSKQTELSVANYINTYIKNNYNATIKLLLVQDAGGSTGCYSNKSKILSAGEKEGTNGRPVVTVVCAKRKSTATKVIRNLTKGCTGNDVRLLQQIIGGIEIDGSYGAGTMTQVKVAQKNLNLTIDGSCGPLTQKALGLR